MTVCRREEDILHGLRAAIERGMITGEVVVQLGGAQESELALGALEDVHVVTTLTRAYVHATGSRAELPPAFEPYAQ